MKNLNLKPGLQCKACSATLSATDDPELCRECMEVVMLLNRDLVHKDDEEDFIYDVENNYDPRYFYEMEAVED